MPGYKWVKYTGSRECTPDMIILGEDEDGSSIVVGRAYHEGDLLPGKAKPEDGVAYVSYNGDEFAKRDFEIMVKDQFSWIPSGDGKVPKGAVIGGHTRDGEPLYIGRTDHFEYAVVGKVHQSHGALYVAFGGKEHSFSRYEVLVEQ